MIFGSLQKKRRIELGLSLRQLSALCEISATTLHSYEKGASPTFEKADRVLKALGIQWLLGDPNGMNMTWMED